MTGRIPRGIAVVLLAQAGLGAPAVGPCGPWQGTPRVGPIARGWSCAVIRQTARPEVPDPAEPCASERPGDHRLWPGDGG